MAGRRSRTPETDDDSADGEPTAAEKEKESTAPLPALRLGDAVTALDVTVTGKRTAPPKPFTDASLIAAMCGVAKFVRDPAVKKILTEADGIGTPATRAAIIETLFERGYVARAGRAIVSTETGRALIASLPEVATTPEHDRDVGGGPARHHGGTADARRVPRARRRAPRAARRRGTRPRPHRGPARRAGSAAGPRPLAPQATPRRRPHPQHRKAKTTMNSASRPIPPSAEPLAPRSLGTLAAALVTCIHPRRSRVRAALDLGPGETGIYWCAACGALLPAGRPTHLGRRRR